MFTVLSLLLLTGAHSATARIHSLKYFLTTSSQVPNLPEFVGVSLVDDVQIEYYDSNTMKAEPKQDWMFKATDSKYWERQTQIGLDAQKFYKNEIEILKERFNQTEGVHIYQRMVGCEWDNETGEVKGYDQYGYDGEDFISMDLETETWIAPTPKSFITKLEWDQNKVHLTFKKNYLLQELPSYLKMFLQHGRSSLLRTGDITEPPSTECSTFFLCGSEREQIQKHLLDSVCSLSVIIALSLSLSLLFSCLLSGDT